MDSENDERTPDEETGELPPTALLNPETGELELNSRSPNCPVKKPFKVPRSFIKNALGNTVDVQRPVNERIILSSTNPLSRVILFLLPSIFLFIPAMIIPMALIEVLLHICAHRKNNFLRSLNITHIYYQSPLHVFVSHFCACCQDESSKDTISKMHSKLNRRFIKYSIECVKQVV